MKTIQYTLEGGIATITFDDPNAPVNTMSLQWQDDLQMLTERILADQDAIAGIVLTSAKSTFFAGADLKGVMRLSPDDAQALFAQIERMKRNFRAIETLGKPVVSLLNGTALGGGWEVALVGHYRIAINDPKAQFGLPEVTLGLLPGAGGVTKTTRLLGLVGAQPYLIEGKTFTPAEAKNLGLVHALVPPGPDAREQLRAQALEWIAAHPRAQHPWEAKDYRVPGGLPSNPALAGALAAAPAMLFQKTRGLYPAPQAILACMVEGLQVDLETALRIESRHLAQLMTGDQAKAMINTFFFNLNAVKAGLSRPAQAERWRPTKVGVLGAGIVGAGIAYVQARKGITTVLKDLALEQALKGKAYSERITQAQLNQGHISAPARQELLNRIIPSVHVQDLKGCDLIIEAVFENREFKERVIHECEPLLSTNGIFATSTSTLPIASLAVTSRDSEKFIGMHFLSPVDKMKLVEIVRGPHTSDQTVARAYDYVQFLGKIPIVVNDARGFFTTRVFGTYLTEAVTMLTEGIPATAVENAGVQCGMPAGPLAMLDETSLTLSLHVLEQTRAELVTAGKTYRPSAAEQLVTEMVRTHKRPGRCGNAGFYDYPREKGARKTLWPQLQTLYEKPGSTWNITDLKDRLLFRQALETARCLAENVLTSVHEANIGSIFGIGFPGWTGGAMQFIYGMGIEAFQARLETLARQYGPGFALDAATLDAIRKHQPVY